MHEDIYPWPIEWIWWNAYANYNSLIVIVVFALTHYLYTQKLILPSDLLLPLLVGLCAWIVYCAIRYGYAVG